MKAGKPWFLRWTCALALLALAGGNRALAAGAVPGPDADFARLLADRTAIERVYYAHRLETTLPFEKAVPPEMIEQLVRRDLDRERTLQQTRGLVITAAEIEAETQRINQSTRAPEVLAELKRALDNDPARFGRTVVEPILVERRLRDGSSNGKRPASARDSLEQVRVELQSAGRMRATPGQLAELLQKHGPVKEVVWDLAPDDSAPAGGAAASASYSAVSTAEIAPANDPVVPAFQELRPELRQLLQEQLRQPGDVSAVVETDDAFWLFLVRERTGRFARIVLVSESKKGAAPSSNPPARGETPAVSP